MAIPAMDMTLDDLIKQNKKKPSFSDAVGRHSRRRRSDPVRRSGKHSVGGRSHPYAVPKIQASDSWRHDAYSENWGSAAPVGYPGRRIRSIETGTKILISNLDYGVSDDDIKDLFSEFGEIKHCGIHYDRSGRSEGRALVVFARRGDALAAINEYNNVQLDGKPLQIELVGRLALSPVFDRVNFDIVSKRSRDSSQRTQIGGRRRRRRGPGRGKCPVELTASALDDDLNKYHEQMETN